MLSASSLASYVSCRLLRVDRVAWRTRAIWPRAVADDGGKCFCINYSVSPGQYFSWLFLIDFNNDDFVGKHNV